VRGVEVGPGKKHESLVLGLDWSTFCKLLANERGRTKLFLQLSTNGTFEGGSKGCFIGAAAF
jgi:hypothetical protein